MALMLGKAFVVWCPIAVAKVLNRIPRVRLRLLVAPVLAARLGALP
jgi:hypothetical protein